MNLYIAPARVIYLLFIFITRGFVLEASFVMESNECDNVTSLCIGCVGHNMTLRCNYGSNGLITLSIVQNSVQIMDHSGGAVNIRNEMIGRAVGSVSGTTVSVEVYQINRTLDAVAYTCSGTDGGGVAIAAMNLDLTNRIPEPVSSNLGANALADSGAITDGETLSKSNDTTIQCQISSTSSPVPQLVIEKNGVDVTCTESDDGSTRTCAHTVLANEFLSSSLDMACYARMCDVYGSTVNFTIASSGDGGSNAGKIIGGTLSSVFVGVVMIIIIVVVVKKKTKKTEKKCCCKEKQSCCQHGQDQCCCKDKCCCNDKCCCKGECCKKKCCCKEECCCKMNCCCKEECCKGKCGCKEREKKPTKGSPFSSVED